MKAPDISSTIPFPSPAMGVNTIRLPEAELSIQNSLNINKDNPSFRIEISEEGKKKVQEERYADIDKTSLPDDVKEALKNIRKLQERIAAKREEIQKIMEDDSLSAETKKSRRGAALAEIQIMESSMSDAMNALNNKMSSHNLSTKDRDLAKGLVGAK